MSTKIVNLKYSFDVKNIKPYETQVRTTFSCKQQTTYDVSLFSTVKFECNKMVKELFEDQKLKGYGFEAYARYAVSRLPEDVTTVNQLRFKTSINHVKKFIYINMELHNVPSEEENGESEQDIEEPEEKPAPRRNRRLLIPEPSNEEVDLLRI